MMTSLFRACSAAPPSPAAPRPRRHAPSGGDAALPRVEAGSADPRRWHRQRPRQRGQVRVGSGGDRGGEDRQAAGRKVSSVLDPAYFQMGFPLPKVPQVCARHLRNLRFPKFLKVRAVRELGGKTLGEESEPRLNGKLWPRRNSISGRGWPTFWQRTPE